MSQSHLDALNLMNFPQRFLSILIFPVLSLMLDDAAQAQSTNNGPAAAPQAAGLVGKNRFEKNVLAYEAADKTNVPPQNAILLAGDSQFYRWKTLHEDLPDYTIINRGIDSFETSDLIYFTDQLVLSYKPRLIILHIGSNDVHNGKSPNQVLADFKAFVAKVRAVQSDVPIAFSSITPSPGRWDEVDKRKETNQVIKDYIMTQPHLLFINLWDAMLTADGKPREDLWVADRVHPNHAGYLLRVKIMRPILGEPDKKTE
jgi:lysophospholipase L1-like esterase